MLKDKITELKKDKTKITLKGEGTIQFPNLGFSGKLDSDAWLELHSPRGALGFVVDFSHLNETYS